MSPSWNTTTSPLQIPTYKFEGQFKYLYQSRFLCWFLKLFLKRPYRNGPVKWRSSDSGNTPTEYCKHTRRCVGRPSFNQTPASVSHYVSDSEREQALQEDWEQEWSLCTVGKCWEATVGNLGTNTLWLPSGAEAMGKCQLKSTVKVFST